MVKHTGVKATKEAKSKKKVLITQPRPESDKSPYFELGRKFGVELDFYPFYTFGGYSRKRFP
jgi:uroporphyrinogen-III synthase